MMEQEELIRRWPNCCTNCSHPLRKHEIIYELKIPLESPKEFSDSKKRKLNDASPKSFSRVSVKQILSAIYNLNYPLIGTLNGEFGVCNSCGIILKNLYTNFIQFNLIRDPIDSCLSYHIKEMNKILQELQSTFYEISKSNSAIKSWNKDLNSNSTVKNNSRKLSGVGLLPVIKLRRLTTEQIKKAQRKSRKNNEEEPTGSDYSLIEDDNYTPGHSPAPSSPTSSVSVSTQQNKIIKVKGPADRITFFEKNPEQSFYPSVSHSIQNCHSKYLVERSEISTKVHGQPSPDLDPPELAKTNNSVVRFNDSNILQRRHSKLDVKYYNCTQCHMSFLSSCGLKSHLHNSHSNATKNRVNIILNSLPEKSIVQPATAESTSQKIDKVKSHKVKKNVPDEDVQVTAIVTKGHGSQSSSKTTPSQLKQIQLPVSSSNLVVKVHTDRTQPIQDIPTNKKTCGVSLVVEYLGDNYDLLEIPIVSTQVTLGLSIPEPLKMLLVFRPSEPKPKPPQVTPTSTDPKSLSNKVQQPDERQIYKESLNIDELCSKYQRFHCRLCKKMWEGNGKEFFAHLSQHSCPICKDCPHLFFLTNEGLVNHLTNHHPIVPQFKCPKCSGVCFNQMELDSHVEEMHPVNPPQFSGIVLERTDTNLYKCNVCDTICKSKAAYEKHKLQNHTERTFHCQICGKLFVFDFELNVHMKNHEYREQRLNLIQKMLAKKPKPTKVPKAYRVQRLNLIQKMLAKEPKPTKVPKEFPSHKCTFCDRRFRLEKMQILHERRTHTGEKPFSCDFENCTKSFYLEETLTKHKAVHEPHAPIKFQCPHCPRKFWKMHKLKRHERTHDSTLYPFECTKEKCWKKFKTENVWNRHTSRCKANEKIHACTQCSQRYPTKRQLDEHLVRHTGVRAYVCDECGASFMFKNILDGHILNVHREKTLECPVQGCGKKFTTEKNRHVHLFTHQEKTFLCNVCGVSFRRLCLLEPHMKIHTGQKDYSCQHCDMKFRLKTSLRIHRTVHTNLKPHVCSVCGKKFRMSTTLRRHQQTHTGEKPYECQKCGMAFADKRPLKKHMLTHIETEFTASDESS